MLIDSTMSARISQKSVYIPSESELFFQFRIQCAKGSKIAEVIVDHEYRN